MPSRNKIFVSYSRKDTKLFEEFKTMMAPALQSGIVDLWDDQRISPGAKWNEEIKQALASARIAVLLVSQNFLASRFIVNNELPPLLKAAREDGVIIFWISLSSCLFEHTQIASYQAAHDVSRPLDQLTKSQRQKVLSETCAKLILTYQEVTPRHAKMTQQYPASASSRRTETEAEAGVQPTFDLDIYRDSIRRAYSFLKLDSLHSSAVEYRLKLWNTFVQSRVREQLPRHEQPKTHVSRAPYQLSDGDDKDDVTRRIEEYVSEGTRLALEMIDDQNCRCIVILGDPGSGKSILSQYIALQWVEREREHVPFLIELRKYAADKNGPRGFLDYLHNGATSICRLDPRTLDDLFQNKPCTVVFDGLDEVIDLRMRETITNEIIRFATTEYPSIQVIVTSRVIGFDSHLFRNADFRHFTVQDFGEAQITEFLIKWHDLVISDLAERERLRERLKDSIAESPAIRDLAANPLLLTMMAVLNRHQELPRDRAELYDQASRVLLQEWDVGKFLPDDQRISRDVIGRREKQEMLRRIAFEMQMNEKGLSPNLITRDKLQGIIEGYFVELGYVEQPHTAANLIIDQLRERNFILCFSGDIFYSFVHRTFLEYFCATEIVWQFKEERTISLDDLKEIFRKRWHDHNWHEVLRVITGTISPSFAEQIINDLLTQTDERGDAYSIFLAADGFWEVRQRTNISALGAEIGRRLKDKINYIVPFELRPSLHERLELTEVKLRAVSLLARYWRDEGTFQYLGTLSNHWNWAVRKAVAEELSRAWKVRIETLEWLIDRAMRDEHFAVARTAVREIASNSSIRDVITILEKIRDNAERIEAREAARFELELLRGAAAKSLH